MANILVVDDDKDVADPLIMYLAFEGHTTRYASDGQEGLIAVSQGYPDLICLDVDMPRLNGPEMAYRLLAEDCGRENIPILLVSAVADLRQIASVVGTPYFLAKPYALDDLYDVLSTALRERRPPQPQFAGNMKKAS